MKKIVALLLVVVVLLSMVVVASSNEVKTKLEEQGVDIENIVGVGAGTYILKEYYTDVLKFFDKWGL